MIFDGINKHSDRTRFTVLQITNTSTSSHMTLHSLASWAMFPGSWYLRSAPPTPTHDYQMFGRGDSGPIPPVGEPARMVPVSGCYLIIGQPLLPGRQQLANLFRGKIAKPEETEKSPNARLKINLSSHRLIKNYFANIGLIPRTAA